MLEDPSRSARPSAELPNARTGSNRSAAAAKQWQHMVSDGFAALTSDTEFEPRMRIRLPVLAPAQLVSTLVPPRQPRSDLPLPARLLRVFRPGWSGS
jgi:hypothetical protein